MSNIPQVSKFPSLRAYTAFHSLTSLLAWNFEMRKFLTCNSHHALKCFKTFRRSISSHLKVLSGLLWNWTGIIHCIALHFHHDTLLYTYPTYWASCIQVVFSLNWWLQQRSTSWEELLRYLLVIDAVCSQPPSISSMHCVFKQFLQFFCWEIVLWELFTPSSHLPRCDPFDPFDTFPLNAMNGLLLNVCSQQWIGRL